MTKCALRTRRQLHVGIILKDLKILPCYKGKWLNCVFIKCQTWCKGTYVFSLARFYAYGKFDELGRYKNRSESFTNVLMCNRNVAIEVHFTGQNTDVVCVFIINPSLKCLWHRFFSFFWSFDIWLNHTTWHKYFSRVCGC